MRNAVKILVGRPEEKRPLGRTRSKWEDSIRTDFREIGRKAVDWIHLVQDGDNWGVCERRT
jgi:hypothetical protein